MENKNQVRLEKDSLLLQMASKIAAAYLKNNSVASENVSEVIRTVYDTLKNIEQGNDVELLARDLRPAVAVNKSVTPDYIVCLEDGKRLKMMKRHLRTSFKMTPEQYREKWGLPSNYPMVAPNYAIRRSQFAKTAGLGRKRKVVA
jgi:predicted transcriptional regulator